MGSFGTWGTLLMIVAVIVVFYFFGMRPSLCSISELAASTMVEVER